MNEWLPHWKYGCLHGAPVPPPSSVSDLTMTTISTLVRQGRLPAPRFSSRAAASVLTGLTVCSFAAGMANSNGGGVTPPPGVLLQLSCEAATEATGVIGRTVALHTDGDGRHDLIAQVEDQLIWVAGPDPLQYSSTLGIDGVSSFAALPSGDSIISNLVVAHGSGADLVERDLDQARIFSPLRTPIGTAAWAGARSIVTVDIDSDGDVDIFGLSSDGTQLLRLNQDLPGVFSEEAPVELGAELSELRSIRWTGGSLALGAIFHGAIESACVLAPSGTLYFAQPFAAPIDDLVVMGDAHLPGVDGLVALSGGTLTVLRPGGIVETAVNVGPLAPTSMSAADLDGDGLCDVLVNSSTSDQVTALLGQDRATSGGLTLVDPNAATAISIPLEQNGASMAGQMANPVGADFDRDGDIDVFQLIESTRGACVQRNVVVNENEFRPVITDSSWVETPNGMIAFLDVAAMTMPDGLAPDRLEVTLSTTLPDANLDDDEYLRLQVVHDVGSATSGSGDDLVTLQIPGELGARSSLLIRGYRDNPATQAIRQVGVEATYRVTRTDEDTMRGEGSGVVTGGAGNSGSQGTPPPDPPTPIDPFG